MEHNGCAGNAHDPACGDFLGVCTCQNTSNNKPKSVQFTTCYCTLVKQYTFTNKKEDFRCAVEGFGRVENWVRLGSSWSREHSASG